MLPTCSIFTENIKYDPQSPQRSRYNVLQRQGCRTAKNAPRKNRPVSGPACGKEWNPQNDAFQLGISGPMPGKRRFTETRRCSWNKDRENLARKIILEKIHKSGYSHLTLSTSVDILPLSHLGHVLTSKFYQQTKACFLSPQV